MRDPLPLLFDLNQSIGAAVVPNSHFDIKGDRVMTTIRRIALVSSVTIALTALVAAADAQSYGPGSGLMGPGMMMGPEMMDAAVSAACAARLPPASPSGDSTGLSG